MGQLIAREQIRHLASSRRRNRAEESAEKIHLVMLTLSTAPSIQYLAHLVLQRKQKCSKNPPSPNRLYSTSFVKTNALGCLPSSRTTILILIFFEKTHTHTQLNQLGHVPNSVTQAALGVVRHPLVWHSINSCAVAARIWGFAIPF